jgi:hypothetical protein
VPQAVEVLRRQQGLSFGAHLGNQILAYEWRWHAEFIFASIIVKAHLLQLVGVCHAIPAEIVTPVAGSQFVVRSRNWVTESLKLIV